MRSNPHTTSPGPGALLIAVCGLDCGGCEIRTAPFDARAAEVLVAWFREMGWLAEDEGMAEVVERRMVCQGCRGDRSLHWSADCWILQCCVDDKGLAFCYQCDDFPCRRLGEWAAQNEGYTEALSRLQAMKEGTP
jgi:hypothetical protein